MSGDLEERMGQLCDELQQALDAGQSVDTCKLAERFSIPEPDVLKALQALQAMHDVLGDDAVAQQHDLAPPRLSDDYEVLDELGRGGMGVVYRAHQKSLDRDLAVKVLRPGDLMFGDAIRRFEREAKSLARLRHRHIVSVHEVGKADGFVYFTMDLIDGCTLAQRLEAQRLENGAMPTTQAVKLLLQVCSAMAYAHGKGVMHRDLKPGNVLLDASGDAFVCDFGLARELGAEHGATMTGQMLGTPAYMSPEQALGDQDRIGEQTDVYALGAILYECLAGKAPFAGLPLAQLMHAVVASEPVPLRKRNARVPLDLQVIVDKAMRKNPTERYATVQALAEDLERFSIGKEILARPRSEFGRAARFVARHRSSILGALLPAALVLLAVWWFVVPSMQRANGVAVATALAEAGNTAGAATVCVELFDGVDPDDLTLAERTLYLEALTDEAARSYLYDPGDDTSQADQLIATASHVVLDASQSTTVALCEQASAEQRAAFDDARRRLIAFGVDLSPVKRPRDDDTTAPGRRPDGAMHEFDVLARFDLNDPGHWTAEQRTAIPTLLRAAHRLPHLPGLRLRNVLFGAARPQARLPIAAYEFVDHAFLDGLTAIVGDRSQPLGNRKDAARLLHRCAWLPFLYETADGKDLVIREADLDWLAQAWPRVRAADAPATASVRADLVAARLADRPADHRAGQLHHWLAAHTGCMESDPGAAAGWWQEHRTTPIRELLQRALGWGPEPPVSAEAVLDRLRQPSRQRAWLHHLLVELAPAGIRIPYEERAPGDTLVTRWERALGSIDRTERPLRLAVLARIDHAVEPTLVWQHTVPVLGEDEVAFTAPIEHALPFLRFYLGTVRPPQFGDGAAPAALHGSVRTHWRAGRFDLEGDVRVANLRHPEVHLQVSANGERHPASYVCEIGRGRWLGPDGSSFEFVVLASLRPADERPERWDLSDWRRALAASLQRVADADYPHQLHEIHQVYSAAFVHVPPARGALRTIDHKLHGLPQQQDLPEYRSDVRLLARLFAGDASALDDPQPEQRDGWFTNGYSWILLALGTEDDRIRKYAWSRVGRLDDGYRSDGIGRVLARARAAGVMVPAAIETRTEAAYLPWQTYVRRSLADFVMFALSLLFLLLGLVLVMFAPRHPRALGGSHALIVFGLITSRQHVWIDGVCGYPSWVPLGLTILGAWTIAAHARGRLWATLAACVWTATAMLVAFERLPHSLATWWIAALLLLSVWWPATLQAASRRKAAQPA
ncbi:MAG: protein kinase domain-containing protein [Planctomycetota bacterium]